jgi:hypothetical protein
VTEQSLIEQAEMAAQRLEHANKVMEELVKRQEAIEARRLLGGQSDAGIPREPQITKEQKDRMDMKNYFKGTALEKVLE